MLTMAQLVCVLMKHVHVGWPTWCLIGSTAPSAMDFNFVLIVWYVSWVEA